MRTTLVHKPFRGMWYWEWQVGPWVFQIRHTDLTGLGGLVPTNKPWYKRFNVWRDSCWRMH